jgi:MoaA/NifB/PqqE/SkfB family radical SAM enzyme
VLNYKKAVRNSFSIINPNQVSYMIFYVTNRCNFRCNFCFYSAEIEKGLKPNEMSVEEIRKFAPTIGPLVQLSMTGGETFLRKEFPEIAGILIDATDARWVTIPTNASLTNKMVRFLEDILPRFPDTYFRLTFSVEGIGEDHDQLRSMPGSYKKIQNSYNVISPLRKKYPNLVLDCNSVFTASSEVYLLDALNTIHKDFKFDNMSVTYARGVIKDESLKNVSKKRYKLINEFLENREKNKEKRLLYPLWRGVNSVSRENLMRTVFDDEFVSTCVAGKKLLVVSETGEVQPCEILGKSFGNLRDYDWDLQTLLKEHSVNQCQKWIKDTKCKCSFECALAANVVWKPKNYPKVISSAIKNIGKNHLDH